MEEISNEKIRELATQALWHTNKEGETYKTYFKFKERFAKMIIRECINKIESYRIPIGNSAAGETASEWTYDALLEIRNDIKETFGIEDEWKDT